MKIWVAACSMIALAMRLSSASCALWVAKPTMPLRLRIVFSQSLIRRTKTSSSSAFQPSSTTMIAAVPSSRSSTRWNRYIIAGVRIAGSSRIWVMSKPTVSALRSVRSRSLSNSQARSPSPHQGRSRDHRSARVRPMAAAEQFGEMAQPAMLGGLVEIGVDRVLDPGDLVDVGAAGEQRPASRSGTGG